MREYESASCDWLDRVGIHDALLNGGEEERRAAVRERVVEVQLYEAHQRSVGTKVEEDIRGK